MGLKLPILESDANKEVLVICPKCKKQARIPIPQNIFKEVNKTLATVRIEKNVTCEHEFIIYIDRNFVSRGEMASDYIISPVISTERIELKKDLMSEFDITIIKVNLYPLALCYTLRGLLFGSQVLIIIEDENEFLRQHYNAFISYIFSNSFDISQKFAVETVKNYESNKKKYKEYLIIKNVDILQDKKKFIKSHDLGVERGMANIFYENTSPLESVLLLNNEVQKVALLTNSLLKLFNNGNQLKNLNMSMIIDYLEKTHETKVNIKYCEFLLQIIKYRYQKSIPNLYRGMEFSKFYKLSK